MVQISTAVVAFILVAPSLAIPVSIQQEFEARGEDLAVRDPSFKSIFNKIKGVFTKKNVHTAERKAENVINRVGKVADLVLRDVEDVDELLERGFDDDVEVFDREFGDEDFEELAARNPRFGSIFKKLRKLATPANIGRVASLIAREEDMLSEREMAQLEELAEREPSFGSFFRKIRHTVGKVVNPKNIGRVANIASYVIREDDDVFERDYSDFEIDELD